MTIENKPSRLYIPQPFASGDSGSTPPVVASLTPIDTISGDTMNFVDGFPSVYSSPTAQGGKPVTRGEMNAIGNLASVNEYYYRCGGINTFDPELAMKIGGYPRGAVLEVMENEINYHRVVSLVDNNKVDFNGDTLTQQQSAAGVTLGGIDNVNWAYCEMGEIKEDFSVATMPSLAVPSPIGSASDLTDMVSIGSFKARRNGLLSFSGSFTLTTVSEDGYEYVSEKTTEGQSETTKTTETITVKNNATAGTGSSPRTFGGTGMVMLCTTGSQVPTQQTKVPCVYCRGTGGMVIPGSSPSVSYSYADVAPLTVTKGTIYTLWVAYRNCSVEPGDFKIEVLP